LLKCKKRKIKYAEAPCPQSGIKHKKAKQESKTRKQNKINASCIKKTFVFIFLNLLFLESRGFFLEGRAFFKYMGHAIQSCSSLSAFAKIRLTPISSMTHPLASAGRLKMVQYRFILIPQSPTYLHAPLVPCGFLMDSRSDKPTTMPGIIKKTADNENAMTAMLATNREIELIYRF